MANEFNMETHLYDCFITKPFTGASANYKRDYNRHKVCVGAKTETKEDQRKEYVKNPPNTFYVPKRTRSLFVRLRCHLGLLRALPVLSASDVRGLFFGGGERPSSLSAWLLLLSSVQKVFYV